MANPRPDSVFGGSIPELYDTLLVPMIFEPYAADLTARLASKQPERVLEIAAGTGAVTRAMAAALPKRASITATDLNQPMLDYAFSVGTRRPVDWRQADALQLPFADNLFDAVVCQFGAMFFPDKVKAFSEARRVLRTGGTLLFNVWDRIENNEFADIVTRSLEKIFPDDPPHFLRRTPHGYCDSELIRGDLAAAGFTRKPEISIVTSRSRAASPRIPAVAYCQGTPLSNEITARDPSRVDEAIDAAAEAIAARFGNGAVDGKIQALVVTIEV
jgi:SAM-dependent methyltransferase